MTSEGHACGLASTSISQPPVNRRRPITPTIPASILASMDASVVPAGEIESFETVAKGGALVGFPDGYSDGAPVGDLLGCAWFKRSRRYGTRF